MDQTSSINTLSNPIWLPETEASWPTESEILAEFLKLCVETNHTEDQLRSLCSVGDKNAERNRSVWLPFDRNRVCLVNNKKETQFNDYVSASSIVLEKQRYIAAQAPNEKTIPLFLKMVVQQNCKLIIMLTSLTEPTEDGKIQHKCSKYWPEVGQTILFDDIEITCTEERIVGQNSNREVICERGLNILYEGNRHHIVQIHYQNWLDGWVPDEDLFMELIKLVDLQDDGINPKLVHCTGGIGRTGVFMTVREIVHQSNSLGMKLKSCYLPLVDTIVRTLRKQRIHMVHTEVQYLFCHYLLKKIIDK